MTNHSSVPRKGQTEYKKGQKFIFADLVLKWFCLFAFYQWPAILWQGFQTDPCVSRRERSSDFRTQSWHDRGVLLSMNCSSSANSAELVWVQLNPTQSETAHLRKESLEVGELPGCQTKLQRVSQHCWAAFTGLPVLSYLTSICFCPCPHLSTSRRNPQSVFPQLSSERWAACLRAQGLIDLSLTYRGKPILPISQSTWTGAGRDYPAKQYRHFHWHISEVFSDGNKPNTSTRKEPFGPHRAIWCLFRQIRSLFNLRVVERCESYTFCY